MVWCDLLGWWCGCGGVGVLVGVVECGGVCVCGGVFFGGGVGFCDVGLSGGRGVGCGGEGDVGCDGDDDCVVGDGGVRNGCGGDVGCVLFVLVFFYICPADTDIYTV